MQDVHDIQDIDIRDVQGIQGTELSSKYSYSPSFQASQTFPPLSHAQKRHLPDKISRLTATAHNEIFKIMKQHNINFSQNKNGVFSVLKDIPSDVLVEINNFVNFCIENNRDLDEYDKRMNECKISNNYELIGLSTNDSQQLDLCDIINTPDVDTTKDDWKAAMQETRNSERVQRIVSVLESNLERGNRKKVNTKFMNAKKRYARKATKAPERIDADAALYLVEEPFIIVNI